VKRSGKVVASERVALEAAEAHLRAGGDAIGATVAGFFAAAGDDAGVLFGALSLLFAQVGLGARAFDGRQRQPGLAAKRARGVPAGAAIPIAARVAAPTGVAALAVALRYGSKASLSPVVAFGVALAKKAGAARRAALLEAVQRLGPTALIEPGVTRALSVAGPSEGGQLGEGDLRAVTALDQPALVDAQLKAFVPWHERGNAFGEIEQDVEARENWSEQALRQQGLCVMDSRGNSAVLCYDKVSQGLAVEELELVLPLNAVPVRRGTRRVSPGTFLPAPAPISIQLSQAGVPLRAELQLRAQTLAVGDPLLNATGAALG
jgi:hypothetical protein